MGSQYAGGTPPPAATIYLLLHIFFHCILFSVYTFSLQFFYLFTLFFYPHTFFHFPFLFVYTFFHLYFLFYYFVIDTFQYFIFCLLDVPQKGNIYINKLAKQKNFFIRTRKENSYNPIIDANSLLVATKRFLCRPCFAFENPQVLFKSPTISAF